MKILKLRFKNLNSLAGEWEIDFTSKEYTSNGIFAITGPTGAGKTTILDAICLALYGKTPRILHISQKSNEIMTRQTSDCFAELTYETMNGIYKNYWGQKRANKKADGKLQTAKYEISDYESKDILATKIKDVKRITEDKTGMDFEQFTRSMLLAQGSFAAFLKASPDERASILEQITGSEIYSNISITVYEQDKIQKNKLELLDAQLSSVSLLTDDEKNELNKELKENKTNETKLKSKNEKCSNSIIWLNNINNLNNELKQINSDIEVLTKKQEEFSDDKERLKIANYAKELELEYDKLLTQRKTLINDEKIQNENNKQVKSLEIISAKCLKNLKVANCAFDNAKKEQEKEQVVIKEVRNLDAHIKTKSEDSEKYQKELNEVQNKIKDTLKSKADIDKKQAKIELNIKSTNEYLMKNAIDEKLINDLSGIIENLKLLNNLKKQRDSLKIELKTTKIKRDKTQKNNLEINEKLKKIEDELSPLIDEQKKLIEEVKNLLNGATIEDLRKNESDFKEELNILNKLHTVLKNIDKSNKALIEIESDKKTAQVANEKNKRTLVKFSNEKKQLKESIKILIDNIALHNKILSLENERDKLQDNKECPLCGALEHPFAKNNITQVNDTETILIEKESLLKKTEKSINELEKNIIKNEELIKYKIKEIDKTQISLISDKNIIVKELKFDIKSVSIEFVNNKITDLSKTIKNISNQIERAGKINEKLDLSTAQIASKKEQKTKCSEQVIADDISLQHLKEEYNKLADKYKTSVEVNETMQLKILETIKQFGIKDLKNVEVSLKSKKSNWLKNQETKDKLELDLLNIKSKVTENKLLHTSQIEQEKKSLKNKKSLNDELSSLNRKRKVLYSEKNPDEEELRIKNKILNLDKIAKEASKESNKASNNFNNLKKQIVLLAEKINQNKVNIEIKEIDFKEQLSKSYFKDEEEFILAILSKDERNKLDLIKNKLHTSQTQLDTSLKNTKIKLKDLKDKELTDDTIENLRSMQLELSAELKELNEITGGLNQKLKIDKENCDNQSEILKDKENQNKEYLRWHNLRELIGSSDGKKYRSFAQGLTFDNMIYYANKQLKKMSNRYCLTRNVEEPLELQVYDNYQAGEIRSTKNLSGGESFIVSLSLALGLSQMASHKIKVDSLFLDEGFGTLDEDSLSVALDTLSNLKQSGKLIGIISHISSLKERISSQIQVTSNHNGTSEISGPGISRK